MNQNKYIFSSTLLVNCTQRAVSSHNVLGMFHSSNNNVKFLGSTFQGIIELGI